MSANQNANSEVESAGPHPDYSAAQIASSSYPRGSAEPALAETAARSPVLLSRSGKIAKLPFIVREKINQRLLDGQDSTDILPWLNALPVVQARMAARFGSAKISAANLSAWRLGGYAEWLRAHGHIRKDALTSS